MEFMPNASVDVDDEEIGEDVTDIEDAVEKDGQLDDGTTYEPKLQDKFDESDDEKTPKCSESLDDGSIGNADSEGSVDGSDDLNVSNRDESGNREEIGEAKCKETIFGNAANDEICSFSSTENSNYSEHRAVTPSGAVEQSDRSYTGQVSDEVKCKISMGVVSGTSGGEVAGRLPIEKRSDSELSTRDESALAFRKSSAIGGEKCLSRANSDDLKREINKADVSEYSSKDISALDRASGENSGLQNDAGAREENSDEAWRLEDSEKISPSGEMRDTAEKCSEDESLIEVGGKAELTPGANCLEIEDFDQVITNETNQAATEVNDKLEDVNSADGATVPLNVDEGETHATGVTLEQPVTESKESLATINEKANEHCSVDDKHTNSVEMVPSHQKTIVNHSIIRPDPSPRSNAGTDCLEGSIGDKLKETIDGENLESSDRIEETVCNNSSSKQPECLTRKLQRVEHGEMKSQSEESNAQQRESSTENVLDVDDGVESNAGDKSETILEDVAAKTEDLLQNEFEENQQNVFNDKITQEKSNVFERSERLEFDNIQIKPKSKRPGQQKERKSKRNEKTKPKLKTKPSFSQEVTEIKTSNDVRKAVYEKWYIGRLTETKEKIKVTREQINETKENEAKKAKETKQDATAAYRRWKSDKDVSMKSVALKRRKSIKAKTAKEERDEKERKKSIELVYKSWKNSKDLLMKENKKPIKKNKNGEEKKQEKVLSDKTFTIWQKDVERKIKDLNSQKKKAKLKMKSEEEKEKCVRDKEALLAYRTWLKKKHPNPD